MRMTAEKAELLAKLSAENYKARVRENGFKTYTELWYDLTKWEYLVDDVDELCSVIKIQVHGMMAHPDYKAHAEINIVTNWKIWEWYQRAERAKELGMEKQAKYLTQIARTYSGLWDEARDFFYEKFKNNDKAQSFYFHYTD